MTNLKDDVKTLKELGLEFVNDWDISEKTSGFVDAPVTKTLKKGIIAKYDNSCNGYWDHWKSYQFEIKKDVWSDISGRVSEGRLTSSVDNMSIDELKDAVRKLERIVISQELFIEFIRKTIKELFEILPSLKELETFLNLNFQKYKRVKKIFPNIEKLKQLTKEIKEKTYGNFY